MAHKPITFQLVGHALTASGGRCVQIPYPEGITRRVTVTDYTTDLPREARILARDAQAIIMTMGESPTDRVIGISVSAYVTKGQISPRGFKAWDQGRNPAMTFDLVEAAPA